MKKNLVVCVCFFIMTVSVFSQNIDKTRYTAIDPFDYKVEEDYALIGTRDKRYKSVVEFIAEIKENNTISYEFLSLDKRTPLILFPNPNSKLTPPSPGQAVTVYYTMNKRGNTATTVLDAYEDNRSKDEKGLGVEKKPVTASNIKKSEYAEISTDDYKDNAFFTLETDDDRKFKSTLQFVSQEGIIFKFSSLEKPGETPAFLFMKVGRRYPPFATGQRMVVYFTASKDYKDFLKLDDIELMR